MAEHSLDKKATVASESIQKSASVTTKKNWQTPQLVELNYDETGIDAGGSGGDIFSSAS